MMAHKVFCIIMSGRRMPDWKIAPADFAVPYAAPNVVKTMEHAHPIAPKKEAYTGHRSIFASNSASILTLFSYCGFFGWN